MIKTIKEHWEDPDGGKNSFQKTIDSTIYQKLEGSIKKPFTTAEIIDILSKVPDEFKNAPIELYGSSETGFCKKIITRTEVLTDGRVLHQVVMKAYY